MLIGVFKLVKCVFKGLRVLRGWLVAGFGISAMCSIAAYSLKDTYYQAIKDLNAPAWVESIGYFLLLLIPIWYLMAIGLAQEMAQAECQKQFEAVGFKSRDGRFPYLVKKVKDKNGLKKSKKYKELYIFKSNIPLTEWIGAKERIETAIDRNIIRFSEGGNKKICQITTVPPECKIPDKINWDDDKLQDKDGVVIVGEGALEKLTFDLNRTPHVLAAGETGSGKSVILRSILWQLISKGARVYMIDFKGGVEFGIRYEKYGEVITERQRAVEVLTELCEENQKRLALFRQMEAKNLPEYNRKTGKNLCRIGVFCDEIAEMLDKKGAIKKDKEIMEQLEGLISSLARLSRATGINLFLGVQRPDANVLTGQIKNNVPVRICGRFADKSASEIVLGNTDAVYLPEIKGRFLFRLGNVTEEFQAYYFDDDLHLHGDVPEVGQMLLYPEQEEKEKIEWIPINADPEGEEGDDKDHIKEVDSFAFAEISEGSDVEETEKMTETTVKPETQADSLDDARFTWSCEEK
jgi:DNA segregation ATPase FtsK/SpoIIIE and related proteins